MRYVLLIAGAAMLVSACASARRRTAASSDDDERGIIAAVDARRAQSDSAFSRAIAARDVYYACMVRVATARAKSTGTATEIAEAAQADCSSDFSRFDQLALVSFALMPGAALAEARRSSDEMSAAIRRNGMQAAIRAVLDERPDQIAR